MKAKNLMILGTASSVGKSIITTGLCRLFTGKNYKVAPFKSQNMALNSFITKDGKEMGRAQVVQAEASKIEPSVEMNPILLKPTSDKKSQVILQGNVYKNMTAMEYHEFKPELRNMISEVYTNLANKNDIVFIEGAGSPAEINLNDNDIVNLGMAKIADAPCILVGDIDRGGVFASVVGTIMLLSEEEKKQIKGVIINKFRGDIEILKPGLKMLEDIIKIPVLGVVPYHKLKIDDEDSLSEKLSNSTLNGNGEIKIEIVHLPHLSNFTDFNPFETIPNVEIKYIKKPDESSNPDLLIIPGSKNTIEDLIYLKESKMDEHIKSCNSKDIPIFGICGGFQILGNNLYDPDHTESDILSTTGLNLLNIDTTFVNSKITTQVKGKIISPPPLLEGCDNIDITGYEIHMGISSYGSDCKEFIHVEGKYTDNDSIINSIRNDKGTVFGTYLHGIFENTDFTYKLINNLRKKKSLPLINPQESFNTFKDDQYDKLAQLLEDNIDMEKLNTIIGIGE
jgi:adenosylcobyric acid synthase